MKAGIFLPVEKGIIVCSKSFYLYLADCLFMTAVLSKELIIKIALYDDALAYKQLFILYHARLVDFSTSILRNRESAEEIVSDVFLKIWNSRKLLLTIENMHLYLYVSVKNLSINRLKKQKREQFFCLDEVKVEFQSIYFDPEQLLLTAEMYKRICAAIEELPPRCQLIFKLIKEDGLSYKEVGQLLNLAIKTIENQMTIALKKIGHSIHFHPNKTISL